MRQKATQSLQYVISLLKLRGEVKQCKPGQRWLTPFMHGKDGQNNRVKRGKHQKKGEASFLHGRVPLYPKAAAYASECVGSVCLIVTDNRLLKLFQIASNVKF